MTVMPTIGTRISVPLQTFRMLGQLAADQTTLQSYYDQLSTGRRVNKIGDDPIAANKAMGLENSIRYGQQLVRNAQEASAFYRTTDEALARIDNALIDVRGLAVEAAQGVLSRDERDALAVGIRQNLEQVIAAGNANFRSHPLLAGVLHSLEGFRAEGSTVLFTGNSAYAQTKGASDTVVPITVQVQDALGSADPLVRGEPLRAVVDETTRLIDTRMGRGIQTGGLRLSDGSQWQKFDLSNAATVGDLKTMLESIELGGRQLQVNINDDGFTLQYADGLPGVLAVADPPGGAMARDLGLLNPEGLRPPPLTAGGLVPQVTLSTRLDSIGDGAIDASSGFRIEQQGEVYEVDLEAAETLGDVIVAINRSGADVRAALHPSGRIDIVGLRAGADYSVGENGGRAATMLGIRSATEQTVIRSLGHGQGIPLISGGPELMITRPDGTELEIDLQGARTIGDVLGIINQHPNNQDTRRIVAELVSFGNGISLSAPPGAGPITVRQPPGGTAGLRLGLIPEGENEATGFTETGVAVFKGQDYQRKEPGGPIDALIRLEQATRTGDVREIGRMQQALEEALSRSASTRGRVGVWAQNLEILQDNAASQVVTLREQLSNAVDADYAQVVSDMTLRQTALEATMKLIAETSRLSVLSFL